MIPFVLKVDGRFVCWDSFKCRWCLGPRRLSEVFSFNPFTRDACMPVYPSAVVVWLKEL